MGMDPIGERVMHTTPGTAETIEIDARVCAERAYAVLLQATTVAPVNPEAAHALAAVAGSFRELGSTMAVYQGMGPRRRDPAE